MKHRLLIVIVLIAALALALFVFGFVREQRLLVRTYEGSGNESSVSLYSYTAFAVGDLFLSYDSTDSNSALWIARSDETFRTWLWPEDWARQKFETLVKWNEPGKVVWSKPGKTTVDLLIEFAPEKNHRVALIRITCSNEVCRSTAQERGIPQDARLSVGDDGSAVLVDDRELITYDSVADLMSGAERRSERLSTTSPDELVASAREAALVINKESLSGEVVEERVHAGITFSFDEPVHPAAVSINNGVQFAVYGKDRIELWDCPWSVLKEDSSCTVYQTASFLSMLSAEQTTGSPAIIHDTACGMTISRGIGTWLLRRNAKTEQPLVGAGIVHCDNGELLTYFQRRITHQLPKRDPVTTETRQLKVSLTP